MDMPNWIEMIPQTQNGVSGVVVRTRDGVCEDGKRRGLFVADGGDVASAVDVIECQAAVGKFGVVGHPPRYRLVNGRVERLVTTS